MSGFFITFESTGDGLGKTTQAKLLADRLINEGYEVVQTFEPNNTAIRELLLNAEHKLCNPAELLLFMADRAEHVDKLIKPSLDAGKIVISDRFHDSSLVYQGIGRGWSRKFLDKLHQTATNGLLPDITFMLDGIPFREMDKEDTFERLGCEFYNKIRTGALHLVNQSDRYVLLNINEEQDKTTEKIYKVVMQRMG